MKDDSEANRPLSHAIRKGSSIVVEDLQSFGPQSNAAPLSMAQAKSYCRKLAKSHYENFSVASCLLPNRIRQDFCNIYAYCRWSDDLSDEIADATTSLSLLDWWRTGLEACFGDQRCTHPVFIALQESKNRYRLSLEPFRDLISAFVQDQTKHRYATDNELADYCRRSANPVGRILLQLAGCYNDTSVVLSDSICTGLQLANFCQDMGEDARRSRIYLPRDRWNDCGVDEQELLRGACSASLQQALMDWVTHSRNHLVHGLPLVAQVPRWLARDVQLFVRGGLSILNNIRRAHFDVWSRRIEVTKGQKLVLLMRAMLSPRSVRCPPWDLSSTPFHPSRSSAKR